MKFRKISLSVSALLLCLSAGAATNQYVQATASETNLFLGEVFHLDLVVKADSVPSPPDLRAIDSFHVTMLESATPTSATNTWLYRYALRPTVAGAERIPAIRIGSQISTPISVTVKKPAATDRMMLRQSLSTNAVYVGEPVLLKNVWDSSVPFNAVKSVDFHFPILNDNRFQLLELYEPGKESATGTTGLPVHGTRILANRKSYTKENVQHQTLHFEKLLIPKKAGRLELAPGTLLCAVETAKAEGARKSNRPGFQYPAYFDNTFFDQNVSGPQWERVYTESLPLGLEVKPLPAEGQPDLFNGMVGEFSIEVSAEPTEIQVGEAITLTVTISASNYMENIFFQPLRFQPGLVNRFEIPSERSLPHRTQNAKVYTQSIRPLSIDNNQIPPIQLSFFSPEIGDYRTVQSDPIPITVSPGANMQIFAGTGLQNMLRTAEGGIRHNYEDRNLLKQMSKPLFGWGNAYLVLSLLLLPPLLFGGGLLISVFGENRHHIQRTAKAKRAYPVFRKNAVHIVATHTNKREIYGNLDRVLRAYLGDRLHLNPGALSFRDAEVLLKEKGASGSTLEALEHLFTLCEAYRFTNEYDEPGDAKAIVRNAEGVVKAVERSLR